MDSIFCCSSLQPYRPQRLSHEAKFTAFLQQAQSSSSMKTTNAANVGSLLIHDTFVVQVVRQINFGTIEWKKYFASVKENGTISFHEVTEQNLIEASFKKLKAFKNFKCTTHNKFFELNVYEKDPVNKHHWRANIARPAGDIDLPTQPSASTPAVAPPPQSANVKSATVGDDVPAGNHEADFAAFAASPKGEESMASLISGLKYCRGEDLHEAKHDDFYEDITHGGYGDGRESQSPQDFTACSADDCGYCGHCMY